MIENVVATIAIPVGIATNMKVDGRDVLVPMATEESSVVAAVCNSSRQCYDSGGFTTSVSGTLMIAQIQLARRARPGERPHPHPGAPGGDRRRLRRLRSDAGAPRRRLPRPGGARPRDPRRPDGGDPPRRGHPRRHGRQHRQHHGGEARARRSRRWTGGKVLLRILSNLADRRLARARAVWPLEAIGGEAVRDGMLAAYHFAEADPYRAATHNKGIMNGVSAVVLATGNDTRAVEAGAHAYAARKGRYSSLTHLGGDGGRLARRHARDADAGRAGRRRDEGAPDGAGLPEGPRRLHRGRAGADHRGRRPGAELRGDEGAGDRRHPEGPHGAARAQRRHRGRRGRATRSSAWPRS